MKVKELAHALENIAPLSYQESYDNSGLQVGDADTEVTGVLVTLDITEAVLDEALERGCNTIVAHHPVIFSGLKRLTGKSYVERIVQKAIKNDLILYAIHTNLDNMRNGVNAAFAERLALQNTSILDTRTDTLRKLYTYVPKGNADTVRDALFAAGAGEIGNYRECSYNTSGTGTFRPGATANPAIGKAGGEREWVEEVKLEMLVPKHQEQQVLRALKASHPYEEVAYEIISLQNANQEIGAGIIGTLEKPLSGQEFLHLVKERMQTDCIRHTPVLEKPISKVAVCGGSGSFLLKQAIGAGADAFVTADFKYHQFFDADNRILVADIGHYESEQFTVRLLADLLTKKFPNFAVLSSRTRTNPVQYFH